MKKFMSLKARFGILAVASVLACPSFLAAAPLPDEIHVGVLASLTGDNSSYGIPIRNSIEMAADEINASGYLGKTKIKLFVKDDKADKQEGISVMTKAITDDKVSVVIGPTLASTAFAADPVAQKAGIPVVATSNTAKGIPEIGNFIFRESLPQASVVPASILAVKNKFGIKKAALMFEATNEFSKSEAEVFKAALAQAGIQLVATESYSKGDTDFRTQLNKLKVHKPDLLVLSCLVGEAVPVLRQAREVGFSKTPIVGGNGFNAPNVLKQAKESAEGLVIGCSWFKGNTSPKSKAFVAAYNKKFGVDPDQFAAQGYTGMWIVATAIKNAGSSDPKAIRDALAQIQNLETALGSFSFNANRDPVHPSAVMVVKNNAFTLFE